MNLWGIILCGEKKKQTVGCIFYVSVWNDKTVGMEDKLVFSSHCGMRSEENGWSYKEQHEDPCGIILFSMFAVVVAI